jgi:hypothetical protein
MGTSRTEPRYKAGFLDYHQQKGTTDPDILRRAGLFDDLFNQIMYAIKMVDANLGPEFLLNKQVTCEVLFAPFATETPEGKLLFVGIEYDKLPTGVELVLVPYRIVDATTGEDIPETEDELKAITGLGNQGKVMFMSNRLIQKQGLDVTAIIPPLENLEELKRIVSDTAGKRDRASLDLRRQVEAQLKPIQIALEKAIDEDPNIIGKDMLGQDYEGIVINSRLGPIKVTSQRQKDIIAQKNAAKAAARTDHGRENTNKTAVVAIGSFVGHKGHEQLWNLTKEKATELGGDPYLFIGNAEGKDDPIPPAIKVKTWHKLDPEHAQNISTVMQGGSLIQKVKHELINPLPGKLPKYDTIVIAVGKDRESMAKQMASALMKAVNKFAGYEHVKVIPYITERSEKTGGTGISFTGLRNVLRNPDGYRKDHPEYANLTDQQMQDKVWFSSFSIKDQNWIRNLMNITLGKNSSMSPKTQLPISEIRLFRALINPLIATEGMLPKSAFAGTGSPTYHKLGPAAQAKGKQKGPVKRGQLVGETDIDSDKVDENLRKWFKEKWVRFGPDGKIRGDCARGDDSEGKPKCLPQSKAQALGKKGRASAAARKRREDPNPERSGKAINVATKKKSNENVPEGDNPNLRKVMVPTVGQRVIANVSGYGRFGLYGTEPGVIVRIPSPRLIKVKIDKDGEIYDFTNNDLYQQDSAEEKIDELKCWSGYTRVQGVPAGAPGSCKKKTHNEQSEKCPHCGGPMFSETFMNEKKDSCYYKVKSRYKVWPSAYASGALVKCRKAKGNWGNKSNESLAESIDNIKSALIEKILKK